MIRKCKLTDVPTRASSYNNIVAADIADFLESGAEAAEVDTSKYINSMSGYNTYWTHVHKYGLSDKIKVVRRLGRTFLVRIKED